MSQILVMRAPPYEWHSPRLVKFMEEAGIDPLEWETFEQGENADYDAGKRKFKGYQHHTFAVPLEQLHMFKGWMVEQVLNVKIDLGKLGHSQPFLPINQKVNVSVPGNGLLSITEVLLCEDYCTDMLRERMSEGWRILAICPQPDQRRPDYIMGKTPDPVSVMYNIVNESGGVMDEAAIEQFREFVNRQVPVALSPPGVIERETPRKPIGDVDDDIPF